MATALVATMSHTYNEDDDKPTAASRFLTRREGRGLQCHHNHALSPSQSCSPGSSSYSRISSSNTRRRMTGIESPKMVVAVDDKKHVCRGNRSLRNPGGAGWLSCSCIDPEELTDVEKYLPQRGDPYYAYMLGNGDKEAKTQAYVGKARNPFWKLHWHNQKRFRTKKTRSSAGKWFLEIICGPFQTKEDAVTFKKAWSKSRGVPSKRARALAMSAECHVGIYDFRLPCSDVCVKHRLALPK